MNQIDLIIIILVLVFSLGGFFRGAIREGISLFSRLAGFLVAVWKTEWCIRTVSANLFRSSQYVFISAFFLIYTITIVCIGIVMKTVLHQTSNPNRSNTAAQRGPGVFLGFFKGLVFASLLTLIFPLWFSNARTTKAMNRSLFYKPIQTIAPALFNWTTGFFPQTQSNYQQVKENFNRIGYFKNDSIQQHDPAKKQ